jgi:2-C-methyl-D-erythritol 4-phosphate cytidylyltransferase/2-C-methyl-D-erythritol 4-phosphate cytidylyltransferase/2-C-methyl-D-erythritol 2,4-cyclodiphosphate synthase
LENTCIVVPKGRIEDYKNALSAHNLEVKSITEGGNTRQGSVYKGLTEILNYGKEYAFIAVHDGARPLVDPEDIKNIITDAREYGSAILAIPAKNTLKKTSNGTVKLTIPREDVFEAQTPQIFPFKAFVDTMLYSLENRVEVTDDCQMFEKYTENPTYSHITVGKSSNIKITTPEDLEIAKAIYSYSHPQNVKIPADILQNIPQEPTPAPEKVEIIAKIPAEPAPENLPKAPISPKINLRIGEGYDVHRLVEGRKLTLGGVEIPYKCGLLGHSDADVLVHAIMDAVLGACGMGDIGKLFPETDPQFKDISSLTLLSQVMGKITEKGYNLVNIDSTIVAQKPKLSDFIPQMQENISKITGITSINVKATTEEKLGFTGTGQGISARAVALCSLIPKI